MTSLTLKQLNACHKNFTAMYPGKSAFRSLETYVQLRAGMLAAFQHTTITWCSGSMANSTAYIPTLRMMTSITSRSVVAGLGLIKIIMMFCLLSYDQWSFLVKQWYNDSFPFSSFVFWPQNPIHDPCQACLKISSHLHERFCMEECVYVDTHNYASIHH